MERKTLHLSFTAFLLSGAMLMPLANAAPANLMGDPVPTSEAERTVVIGQNTAYVNVTGGEIIKFVVDGKSFAWNFDTPGNAMSFELAKVAPAGMLDHKVVVYVARDPAYFGGP